MLIVACALVVALVAVAYLLLRSQARADAAHERDREAWVAERRELLNRVQRPEQIPVGTASFVFPAEQEIDEIAQVGQIDYSMEEEG